MKRPANTLHEAMQMVLQDYPDRTASTHVISNEIARRQLYLQQEGDPPFPEQIFLRAKNYPQLFEVIDRETIRLVTH